MNTSNTPRTDKIEQELQKLRAESAQEVEDFIKHVGAASFKEAVSVVLRTKEQDEAKIEEMYHTIKSTGAELQRLREVEEAAVNLISARESSMSNKRIYDNSLSVAFQSLKSALGGKEGA